MGSDKTKPPTTEGSVPTTSGVARVSNPASPRSEATGWWLVKNLRFLHPASPRSGIMKLFPGKKPFLIYLAVCTLVTAPFLLLTLLGQLQGEAGLILLPIMLLGFPWIFLYFVLPPIPGLTAAATTPFGVIDLLLFFLPVYLNFYLLTLLIEYLVKRK